LTEFTKVSQRLLIVEEALKNRNGHWYEYNRAIVVEARRRNIHTTILTHQTIEEDLRLELAAQPYFPVTSWDHVYYHPSEWRRYIGILRHNFRVARWMRRHFASNAPYDVVLVPTVVLYHWLAWRWLAFRGCGRHFHKLVLTTRNNAGEYDPATRGYRYGSSARVLRRVVASFRSLVAAGRVELASDSSRLAAQYGDLCGVPFTTYPHPRPTDHLSLPNRRIREPQRPLVFSALGPPRYEKGSDLILEAIRLLREKRPDLPVHFVLQWNMQVHHPAGKEYSPSAELQADPGVVFIRGDLSSAEYQQQLEASDALLVPYRRSQYYARLSGVAIEAFQSGVACICISDTWVADALQSIGSGIAIQEESAVALVRAMIEFAERRDELQSRAIERIPIARKAHSPATFVDMLFD
jgi:glycosyltransferase involved in cell wall biosynthesis